MPPKGKGHAEEEGGGHSVGLWYVSFSDMITLLLSFFVMLTTFSSFSKESLDKFEGAWAYMANYSIFPNRHVSLESIAPMERQVDWTARGSEKPTDSDPDAIRNPRESFWLSNRADAYADRRTFYIPSTRLFWGKGSSLIQAGRKHLDMIAKFMKLNSCQMVIGESLPSDADAAARAMSLERAWTIVEYCSGKGSIPAERFILASPDSSVCQGMESPGMFEVTLLSKSVIR